MKLIKHKILLIIFVLMIISFSCFGCKKEKDDSLNKESFILSFETYGATEINSVSCKKGEIVNLKEYTTSLEGFDFKGWYLDSNYTTAVDEIEMIKNVTVYAYFDDRLVTLSFETNGGSSVDSIIQYQGTVIESPQTPTKEGYVFKGWYKDEDLTKKFDFIGSLMYNNDFTLYAKWDKASTISFNSNVECSVDAISAIPGDEVKAPTVDMEGYIFDGFYKDDSYKEKYVFTIAPKEDFVVYLKWHKLNNDVSLTFVVDNKTYTLLNNLVEQQNIFDNEEIEIGVPQYPVAEESDYYLFDGWYYDTDYKEKFDGKVPAQNSVLYGKFIRNAKYSLISFSGLTNKYFVNKGQTIDKSIFDDIEKNLHIDDSMVLDGYLTENGKTFLSTDLVSMDMELLPNIYSKGLKFEEVHYNQYDYYGNIIDVFAGYRVASMENDFKTVVIPTYYKDYKVIEIGSSAFENKVNLEKVNIPTYVTKINNRAFAGCSNLSAIDFPLSLNYIGDEVFSSCAALANVVFNSNLNYLGYDAFEGSLFLNNLRNKNEYGIYIGKDNEIIYELNKTMVLPTMFRVSFAGKDYKMIAGGAFEGTSVYYVKIPSSIEIICARAFQNCSSLDTIEFEDDSNLINVYEQAFANCSTLTNIVLPDSIVKIGNQAFLNCEALTSINFPKNLSNMGDYLFENCTSLVNIGFYNSGKLTIFSKGAFKGCTSLEGFIFPDSVKEIKSQVFDGCTSLSKIYLGYSVASLLSKVNKDLFVNCDNIKNIYFFRKIDKNGNFIKIDANAFPILNSKGESFIYNIYVPYASETIDNSIKTYVELYQEQISAKNKEYVKAFDVSRPKVEIYTKMYSIIANSNYDLLGLLLSGEIFSASDNITPADKLTTKVYSVYFGSEEIKADNNGLYDFSKPGDYIVKYVVFDEFGNGTINSLTIKVELEEI